MPPKAERKPRSFMKTCHSSGAAMRSAQRCRDAQRLAGAQLTCGIASASTVPTELYFRAARNI